jgi:two-component system, NtrC family, response regulator AtoC
VCIDCSTIPENLIESELFGYERGAFTGANERKSGRLEMANGGTLFLDEIGNMTLSMQMKLLRVIQERTLTRLGGKSPVHIDIRLIAATNQDLKQSIAHGTFREDLFYRLNEFPLRIPPLRERSDDVFMLAKFYLDRYSAEYGKQIKSLSPAAQACLAKYPWPGNVRELQGALKRAVILAADRIEPEHLPPEIAADAERAGTELHIQADWDDIRPIKEVSREVVAQVEKELIVRALKKSQNNKIKTARWLGIDYKTLFNKLKQYGLEGFGRGEVGAGSEGPGGPPAPIDIISADRFPALPPEVVKT